MRELMQYQPGRIRVYALLRRLERRLRMVVGVRAEADEINVLSVSLPRHQVFRRFKRVGPLVEDDASALHPLRSRYEIVQIRAVHRDPFRVAVFYIRPVSAVVFLYYRELALKFGFVYPSVGEKVYVPAGDLRHFLQLVVSIRVRLHADLYRRVDRLHRL